MSVQINAMQEGTHSILCKQPEGGNFFVISLKPHGVWGFTLVYSFFKTEPLELIKFESLLLQNELVAVCKGPEIFTKRPRTLV